MFQANLVRTSKVDYTVYPCMCYRYACKGITICTKGINICCIC